MVKSKPVNRDQVALSKVKLWRQDWTLFAKEALGAKLDAEMTEILKSVQHNRMTAVASGTARGKDYLTAVASVCFMYLTPVFEGKTLIKNTKVAMTAPSDRQVKNIMVPEVRRLIWKARKKGIKLPGRLIGHDIRTDYDEWFLTGFKADDNNEEAWTGFHASNTMFAVTEASGISETIWSAIEGNLQGNSRLLLVFNPNVTTGYAANALRSGRFHSFRLNSLNAPNVIAKKEIIPGQVDYEWVKDKVEAWCEVIDPTLFNEGEGDFEWDGKKYRPNDLFRIKVLGMFPKVDDSVLVPLEWIEIAENRWKDIQGIMIPQDYNLRLGSDVAGMGRDNTVFCPRHDTYVDSFIEFDAQGQMKHMEVAGRIAQRIKTPGSIALIDTIGEGAGVYSRLDELGFRNIVSAKVSESAEGLTDTTGQFKFANMRSYLYWAVRDFLNPAHKLNVCIPPSSKFKEEATNIKYRFRSDGKIEIEAKDDIKKRIKRSPDHFDAMALTFHPGGAEGGNLAEHNASFF